MDLATLIADDLDLFDGLSSVTYRSVRNTGDVDATINVALRHEVTVREAAFSAGAYAAGDVIWAVKRPELAAASITPKPGDIVVAPSGNYTVLAVTTKVLDTRVDLVTRNLAVVYDLQHLVDVYEPVVTADAAGTRVTTWVLRHASVRARIQPLEATTISESRAKRGDRERFVIYVAENLTIRTSWQIRHGTTIYAVTGFRNKDRIDELMQIDAEIVFGGN